MAFSASGTDYRGYQSSKDRKDEIRTAAEDRAGRAAKQRRIDSEESPMQGIANIARVGAAIYTGGASEASGLGAMGSKALQGRKSDGSSYDDPMGDVIGTVAGGYNMMEGMKQKDISDLKAEDIAQYDRDIEYAQQFPEGSNDRKGALVAARRNLENTQSAQKYGDRADTNPFTYKKGRRDAPDLDPLAIEGSLSEGKGGYNRSGKWMGEGADPFLKTKAEQQGATEFEERQLAGQLDKQKALKEARTSAREDASRRGYKSDAAREEDRRSVREGASRRGYKTTDQILDDAEKGMSVGKIDEDRMWDRLSNEDDIDREYGGKELIRVGSRKGELTSIPMSDYESDSTEKYRMANEFYKPDTDEPNTYLEKAAKKLSSKDEDKKMSALDQIAFDTKGKALGERGGFLRGFDRLLDPKQGKEDAQHWAEFQRQQKEALAREHKRTGGPNAGEWRKRGERPESALMKRKRREGKHGREQAELYDRLKDRMGALA